MANTLFNPLAVQEVIKETADCVSITLAVPDDIKSAYQFEAGQYVTFKQQINEEEVRRSYSICTAAYEGSLKVAVKKVLDGRFSTYANETLKAGDVLETMAPMGKFILNKDLTSKAGTYVFFAAGSGITPTISLIKTLLNHHAQHKVILFYGNRTSDSVIFKEELEDLKDTYVNQFSLHYLLSKEILGSALFNGRINKEKTNVFAKHFFDGDSVNQFFICGPEQMIFDVKDSLEALGIDKQKIKFELFSSPEQPKRQNTSTEVKDTRRVLSQIKIKQDGNEYDFNLYSDGDSILDAALNSGADLPFACKGGVCCTCKAKLESGTVNMEVNYGLEPDEIEAGYILTCQAHPTTDSVYVNFDA